MKKLFPTLYIEINYTNLIFFVVENDGEENYRISFQLQTLLQGINESKINDLDQFYNNIKKNIYEIEKKLNYTFREVVLILENFKPSFINLTGFKKLNGSQVLRENITYILNTLKSYVDETESKKNILHIFNSKFFLDNKKIDNLPIGLFGDFYSHELSFTLINSNEIKNLKSIFEKCNLKIKKILVKSFIKGAYISDQNKDDETFFEIKINNENSKVFYFENNSLKFEQDFNFGLDIIIRDINKITALKIDVIKEILEKVDIIDKKDDELLDKKFFNDEIYRKIKVKLIYDIIKARVTEFSELTIFKNVNFIHYLKYSKNIYLEFDLGSKLKIFENIFERVYSDKGNFDVRVLDNISGEKILKTTHKLVHFGWKKEAIPVTEQKKSLIARFFDAIFD